MVSLTRASASVIFLAQTQRNTSIDVLDPRSAGAIILLPLASAENSPFGLSKPRRDACGVGGMSQSGLSRLRDGCRRTRGAHRCLDVGPFDRLALQQELHHAIKRLAMGLQQSCCALSC